MGLVVSLKPRMPLDEEDSLQALSAASGGERQRSSAGSDTGYSETAQRTGKPSFVQLYAGALYKGAIVFSEH